ERRILRVARHTDDRDLRAMQPERVPERTRARPEALREGLVHYRHCRRALVVATRELSARQQRDTKHVEVSRVDLQLMQLELVRRRHLARALDARFVHTARERERQP